MVAAEMLTGPLPRPIKSLHFAGGLGGDALGNDAGTARVNIAATGNVNRRPAGQIRRQNAVAAGVAQLVSGQQFRRGLAGGCAVERNLNHATTAGGNVSIRRLHQNIPELVCECGTVVARMPLPGMLAEMLANCLVVGSTSSAFMLTNPLPPVPAFTLPFNDSTVTLPPL